MAVWTSSVGHRAQIYAAYFSAYSVHRKASIQLVCPMDKPAGYQRMKYKEVGSSVYLLWLYSGSVIHGEQLSSLFWVCSGGVPQVSTCPTCCDIAVSMSPTGSIHPACPSSAVAVSSKGSTCPGFSALQWLCPP